MLNQDLAIRLATGKNAHEHGQIVGPLVSKPERYRGKAGFATHSCARGKPFDVLAERALCPRWYPQGDLNPCFRNESPVSSAELDDRGTGKWLRNLDSNQDYLIQSQACYRCTIPQECRAL